MTIHFYLKFHTHFGQFLSISGNLNELGNDKIPSSFVMSYFNDEYWHATIRLTDKEEFDQLTYRYILHNEDGSIIIEGEQDRNIDLYHAHVNEINLLDAWNDARYIENAFYTKAFQDVLLRTGRKPIEPDTPKLITHEFRVK